MITKVNGKEVRCVKCGSLLFVVKKRKEGTEIEIKCKHRSNGCTCNTINTVVL